MDINYIFKQYGYNKVPFEKLPPYIQGYINALQHTEETTINTLLASHVPQNDDQIIAKIKYELAQEVLEELKAYLRTEAKEVIIAVVDGMNTVGEV